VEDDGGIDPTGLDQPGAIAKRRRLWAAFQKKNAAVRQFFSGLGGTLDGQMRREGLSAKRRAEVAEGLLKSINRKQATIDRVRDADDELCDLAEEIFKLLEKNAGKWEASEHVVQFDNENAAGIYNELISEIQAVARKQAAAQRELTGAMLR